MSILNSVCGSATSKIIPHSWKGAGKGNKDNQKQEMAHGLWTIKLAGALQPKERWLGLGREIGMCPMDLSLWRVTVQCFLWAGKRNKVIKKISEQTSNMFTPHVDKLWRASTKGCLGWWELGLKRSLLLVHTQRLTKCRKNSHLQVKMQIL